MLLLFKCSKQLNSFYTYLNTFKCLSVKCFTQGKVHSTRISSSSSSPYFFVYGYPDRTSRIGMLFSNWHNSEPVCVPISSASSLLIIFYIGVVCTSYIVYVIRLTVFTVSFFRLFDFRLWDVILYMCYKCVNGILHDVIFKKVLWLGWSSTFVVICFLARVLSWQDREHTQQATQHKTSHTQHNAHTKTHYDHHTAQQHITINTHNSNWLTARQTLQRRGKQATWLMNPFVLSCIAALVEVNMQWVTEFLPI
jgi:hypothetical protein